jgi:dTDP-3-amino-3,4,6-trideoxy-alpha-D-glucose transaminase
VSVAFVDLRRQHADLRAELDHALAEVVGGERFVGGPRVERFEQAFAAFCGAAHAVGVANGTDAIELALRALGIGPGDEVITAANTCIPTVAGIEASGATPVLVDIDAATFTLDPAELAGATTGRTRAIVPVHLYGQCADTDAIASYAREHGLAVVEDAAQAHGSAWNGRRAGTLGTAAAFSFYPTKNLGALGDGGAIVTSDAGVAVAARELRSFGERAGGDVGRRGSNSRLDPLQAALLSVKLRRLEAWNARRRELAALYRAELEGVLPLPAESPAAHHVYHLFVVRSPGRDALGAALARRGVATLVHYPRAVHEHPVYRHLDRPGRLARSERAAREVLSLPLYPELTDEEAQTVAAAVREACAA